MRRRALEKGVEKGAVVQQGKAGEKELKRGGEQSSCQAALSQSLSWRCKGMGTWRINIVFSKEEKKKKEKMQKEDKGKQDLLGGKWGRSGIEAGWDPT